MPLLGTTAYKEFTVELQTSTGVIDTVSVIATDSEHAAWIALELSIDQGSTLLNVLPTSMWE